MTDYFKNIDVMNEEEVDRILRDVLGEPKDEAMTLEEFKVYMKKVEYLSTELLERRKIYNN